MDLPSSSSANSEGKSVSFRAAFDKLVDAIWRLQSRAFEIQEFENQWADVFDRLKKLKGTDCSIRIRNFEAYRAFHWDRFHVLTSDLHSLLVSEAGEEFAVCRKAIDHLQIGDVASYLNNDSVINFIYQPGYIPSPEEEASRAEEIRFNNATAMRAHCIDAMKTLFPNISDDFKPQPSDFKDLKSELHRLVKGIKAARNFFDHKYEERIVAAYREAAAATDITKVADLINSFFRFLRAIGLIHHGASYGDFSKPSTTSISDQIDIILFGSIAGSELRFAKFRSDNCPRYLARERYFGSSELTELIHST